MGGFLGLSTSRSKPHTSSPFCCMSKANEATIASPKTHACDPTEKHPISVSAVPFGPGIDIWRSSRFIGALMRSLCLMPGGLARFVPCSIGANHCILRHVGWEKCGHGLTSRPREGASGVFLDQLLQ